jgi:hypothetical protein
VHGVEVAGVEGCDEPDPARQRGEAAGDAGCVEAARGRPGDAGHEREVLVEGDEVERRALGEQSQVEHALRVDLGPLLVGPGGPGGRGAAERREVEAEGEQARGGRRTGQGIWGVREVGVRGRVGATGAARTAGVR